MSLIAIIDDDPDIIDATSLVLMANGFEVITANNPGDGLKIIQEQKPALVILDVMMQEPDDGFFLAQKLRRDGVNTPILMYTSVSKALGFQFGKSDMVPVDDFVEKPVSADVLIAKVNKLLDKS
ncbi:hypothetical protein MASR2M39_26950 [Ignavibacteriales bacterium]